MLLIYTLMMNFHVIYKMNYKISLQAAIVRAERKTTIRHANMPGSDQLQQGAIDDIVRL